jgi:hypothetical protein
MKFRKYEFSSQNEWNTLKPSIQTIYAHNNASVFTDCNVAELGYLIKTPAVIDSNNNIITPAILSTKFAVDILWHNDIIPASFKQYEVWPKDVGSHTFWGAEDLYKQDYDKRK